MSIAYKNTIWGRLPIEDVLRNPEVGYLYFNDFNREGTGGAPEEWVETQAGSAGTAAIIDGAGGILELDSDSTTADQGIQIQQVKEQWKLQPGSIFAFEAKVAVVDTPDKAQFFCGLAVTDTSVFAAGENSTTDHIGFEMGATSLAANGGKAQFVSEKDGTRTTVSNVHTWDTTGTDLSTCEFVRLGFYYDGTTVTPYVNGVAQTKVTTNIPDDEELTLTFVCQSEGTNSPTAYVDWVKVFSTYRL